MYFSSHIRDEDNVNTKDFLIDFYFQKLRNLKGKNTIIRRMSSTTNYSKYYYLDVAVSNTQLDKSTPITPFLLSCWMIELINKCSQYQQAKLKTKFSLSIYHLSMFSSYFFQTTKEFLKKYFFLLQNVIILFITVMKN